MRRIDKFFRVVFMILPFFAFVVGFADREEATYILAWCILYHLGRLTGPREP